MPLQGCAALPTAAAAVSFPSPAPLSTTDISHTEAQLRAALRKLDLLRHQEERQLGQRAAGLQREFEAAMAALESRFLADVEALQASVAAASRDTARLKLACGGGMLAVHLEVCQTPDEVTPAWRRLCRRGCGKVYTVRCSCARRASMGGRVSF